ncbi:hypothetical protein NDU88_003713 [Pleurodeles waltl]|uniref:Uncharacterized protein n=1 Tax=Pleurodeles waltl TaxID=8319 RepID=A0AAV7VG37_PLEWA|nr:hypothetical protein NDU88_003713 [Pleurodeles waltl]
MEIHARSTEGQMAFMYSRYATPTSGAGSLVARDRAEDAPQPEKTLPFGFSFYRPCWRTPWQPGFLALFLHSESEVTEMPRRVAPCGSRSALQAEAGSRLGAWRAPACRRFFLHHIGLTIGLEPPCPPFVGCKEAAGGGENKD